MPNDKPAPRPSLKPDSVATRLGGKSPGIPTGFVSFKGYLGPAAEDGMCRIYLDNSFWKWLVVRDEDIKFREDVPANEKDPRSVFWVERDARLITCKVDLACEIEDDVWGGSGGAGAYGRPPY